MCSGSAAFMGCYELLRHAFEPLTPASRTDEAREAVESSRLLKRK